MQHKHHDTMVASPVALQVCPISILLPREREAELLQEENGGEEDEEDEAHWHNGRSLVTTGNHGKRWSMMIN